MSKKRKVISRLMSLVLLSAPAVVHAEFVTGMSKDQAGSEIVLQLNAGASLEKIAKEANAAGLDMAQVAEILLKSGQSAEAVVEAVINANPSFAAAVVSVAVKLSPASQAAELTANAVSMVPDQVAAITKAGIDAAPAQRKEIIAAVISVPGVNPQNVLAATAAGPASGNSPIPVGLPNSTPTAGIGGGGSVASES